MPNKCKICNASSDILFSSLLLKKYKVNYLKCSNCGFMQTEKPYWLDEAYSSAISSFDIGLISRNIYLSNKTELIIKSFFDTDKPFLDYGGGYGMFVRMMRDKGYSFYRYDTYCENLFAKNFDVIDNKKTDTYELVTCFEVFEHLEEPLTEIQNMLQYAKSILFSTELLPSNTIKSAEDWWYFLPETGQHIAFHTPTSLKIIAAKFNLNVYSFDSGLHLLTPLKISTFKLKLLQNRTYKYLIKSRNNRMSLLQDDFKSLRNNL